MKPRFILLMGVAGSGKTTVGKLLASKLGWKFYDGDDFHSPENIAKMRSGSPLTDDDRRPWLVGLHQLIATCMQNNQPGILACSALKEKYREILLQNSQDVLIVYLKGSYEQILLRMTGRSEHYMKSEMLRSQFDALEEPMDAIVISVEPPIDEIVSLIIENIHSKDVLEKLN